MTTVSEFFYRANFLLAYLHGWFERISSKRGTRRDTWKSWYRGISWREVAVQEAVRRLREEGGGVVREGKTGASHRQLYFGREKRAVHKNMKKSSRARTSEREWENERRRKK